jgi:hypothetical protein
MANLIGDEGMVRARVEAFRDVGVTTLRLSTAGKTWAERTAALEAAMDLIRRVEPSVAESSPG